MHCMLWRLMIAHKVYRHYRKRMQQHGMWGEMTKPTNCAKYLMIEQPTICSKYIISILPLFLQQARTQGGVHWVRTNPPMRSQVQND